MRSLGIKSADEEAGFDELKAFRQQLFSLLSSSTGNLQFHMPVPAEAAQGGNDVTMIQVKHSTPLQV